MPYHKNPPWGLLMCVTLSLAHIKCAHPLIPDISFRSVFKLPCILAKHCQDPFLLFFLIACAYGVSGCSDYPLCLSSPLHSSASVLSSSPLPAGIDKWLHPVSHGSPFCTAATDQERTAEHGYCYEPASCYQLWLTTHKTSQAVLHASSMLWC